MKEVGEVKECANFGHDHAGVHNRGVVGHSRQAAPEPELPTVGRSGTESDNELRCGTMPRAGLLSERKLSIKQAAAAMSIGATTLRRLINDGQIPVIRLYGKMLLLERDIEAYLRQHYGQMEIVQPTRLQACVPEVLKNAAVLVKAK